MAKNNGFLSGYSGNNFQRTGRWLVDRLLPGNQRAPDGTLDNSAVWKGVAVRGAGILANALAPGSGALVGQIGKNYINTGSILPQFAQNGLNAYQQSQLAGGLSNVQRDMQMAINARNGWGAPQSAVVGPATNLPAVQAQPVAQSPWSGSLANANPFGRQYGGNLGFGGGPAQRGIGGNLSFGGGRSGFNNGVGAGTGYGAGSIANTGFGSGSAAAGFGIGTGAASSSSPFALRDALTAAKINRV